MSTETSNTKGTTATIFPSLTYDDAPAAIEWLCAAFGFEKRLVVPLPDGGVMHSELTLGPGMIMVSTRRPAQGRLSPQELGGVTQALSVQVDDPDAHCARALAAGATLLEPLQDEHFGARSYMVKDPEGHHWNFSNYRPGAYWDGGDGSASGA